MLNIGMLKEKKLLKENFKEVSLVSFLRTKREKIINKNGKNN